ncbi:MAG: hypothetical protein CMH82_00160, partial [Nocardioides sp.]|nr:hypothetical protein [Nocardioides sp.]
VKKAEEQRSDEINTCIACNQACLDLIFQNKRASCMVNPLACYETEVDLQPASSPRSVAATSTRAGGPRSRTTPAAPASSTATPGDRPSRGVTRPGTSSAAAAAASSAASTGPASTGSASPGPASSGPASTGSASTGALMPAPGRRPVGPPRARGPGHRARPGPR